MSGFDTSQPIADDESLKKVDDADTAGPDTPDEDAESAAAEKLGDATPGPR